MKINRFEEIMVWQKAREFVNEIYSKLNIKDFGFRDQMRNAAVSIMNNIAEGFERETNKEFKRFLFVARASGAEVRSMLYLALDLKYINEDEFQDLIAKSEEISKMIYGFIEKLK